MSSYTTVFGGEVISPAYVSYSSYALTALNSPLSVALPLAFQNSLSVLSQIADLTATTSGLAIILPSMLDASVGWSVLFINRSAYTITIYANDGITVVTTITTGQSTYLYLTDNSTANGSLSAIPFGSGYAAVVSVGVTSSSPSELIVTGSPIVNSGVINLALGADLLALTSLGSGTGILSKTGTSTYTTRTITGTANQISVSNGDGVSGNPVISLASNVSGLTSLTAGNIRLAVAGTNTITTADSNPLIINQNLSLTPVTGTASALRWYAADGTHYVAFQGGATIASNLTWTLPVADGSANQVLTTSGAGVLSWSSVGSGTVASVAGTLNRITSTGGTNPIIDISASYVGQSSITTLGTVTTGTWQATPVVVTYGGTGATTFTAYGVIVGGTTNTGLLQSTATAGTAGQVLTSNGAAAIPSWQSFPVGQNMIVNGDFQVWQRGAGGSAAFTVPASTTEYIADRWQIQTHANQICTVTQYPSSGLPSGRFTCVVQRNAGQTGTTNFGITTSLTRSMCAGCADGTTGQPLTISFTAAAGANFSSAGSGLGVTVFTGTGTSDSSVLSSWTGQATLMNTNQAITTGLVRYSLTTSAVGASVTQIAVQFQFTPIGTAGVNDSFSITDVQLEIGTTASAFERKNFNEQLANCLPFYEKSFPYSTAPADAVGATLGEPTFYQIVAATTAMVSPSISYKVEKFSTPSLITLYNPVSAASSNVYNETVNSDCSATSTTNNGVNGFSIATTTPGGSAVGNILGINWSSFAELV